MSIFRVPFLGASFGELVIGGGGVNWEGNQLKWVLW